MSLALETDVRFEGRLSRQAQPPQALEPALKRCKTPSRSRRLCSRTLSSSAWACAPLCVGAPWPVEHLLAEPSETVFQNFLCAEVSASEPQKCPNRRRLVSAPEKRLRNGLLQGARVTWHVGELAARWDCLCIHAPPTPRVTAEHCHYCPVRCLSVSSTSPGGCENKPSHRKTPLKTHLSKLLPKLSVVASAHFMHPLPRAS